MPTKRNYIERFEIGLWDFRFNEIPKSPSKIAKPISAAAKRCPTLDH